MKEDLKHIFMLVQAHAFWLTTMLSLIHIIVRVLKDSFKDYKRLEITLKGYVESELLQRFDYSGKLGDFNDYLLFEKVYSIDENAEQTKIILRKNIDISEVNYVD